MRTNKLIERLSQGTVDRDVRREGAALLSKWQKTGLLEGLKGERDTANMSVLLENQVKEVLRESTTMSAGDVEGFAAVAFPIVRRVFGGLIANELVSVQAMSLPSGLIFFLDYQYTNSRLGHTANDSVYGQGAVAKGIADGVSLSDTNLEKSFWSLNNGYAAPTGSVSVSFTAVLSGTLDGTDATLERVCRFDPDLRDKTVAVGRTAFSGLTDYSPEDLVAVTMQSILTGSQIRRLNQFSGTAKTNLLVVLASTGSETAATLMAHVTGAAFTVQYPLADNFNAGGAIGSVVGSTPWGLEANSDIPEIDIKIDSLSVTAETKKLKAKWSPELGQDLNAYHNIDAEVELVNILSEIVALDIDMTILEDLVKNAHAGTYYWSRRPGKFVARNTGATITTPTAPPDFTGNVWEWYETLIETINDVSAQIHRKTLRGGATFIVVSPEVANILESTNGYRATATADEDKGTAGIYKGGSLSKKWDVYVNPYFPRNLILIGRKGSSFLESGYVYAPYVPLQVTPTILGIEDFVPRKGVMTRFARKMVRPDMYGLVVVMDLLG